MIALVLTLMLIAQDIPVQQATGRVSGTLKTTAGMPAAGVRVVAIAVPEIPSEVTTTSYLSIAQTDQEGRFLLQDVPPGRYYIAAGRLNAPTFYPGTQTRASGTVLSIVAGASVSGIEFTVGDASIGNREEGSRRPTMIPLPVQVSVENGRTLPPPGAGQPPTIQLISIGGFGNAESPLSRPSLEVPYHGTPDEYQVRIANLPDGYVVKSIMLGGKDLTADRLKVPLLAPPRLITYTGEGELQQIADRAAARVTEAARTLAITLSAK
ncbi:MAG TPA: hypothetical protein VFE29_06130 [Terriglobia bacterium]|nr:hypothetical protein [Terriglobia bacterium]